MIVTVTLNPAVDLTVGVENFRPGEVNRTLDVHKTIGGKGINVSRTLRLLGVATTALTVIGTDSVQLFQRLSKESGFPTVYISVPGEIRTNIHIVDRGSGNTYKVNQPGVPLQGIHFEHFTLLLKQQLKTARMLSLGGSLPPGRPNDSYRVMIEIASAQNVPVVIDAEGAALRDALAAKPFLAKPNRRELEVTLVTQLDSDEAILNAARELIRLGAHSAVISNGPESLVAIHEGIVYTAIPPRIVPRGCTGAGDALTAGIMSELSRNAPFSEALRTGIAVAAATCLTDEGEPVRSLDIAALREKVEIRSHP